MNQNDTVKIVTDLTNKNLERMSAFGELNLRSWERLAARQMEVASYLMEQSVRSVKLASESKSYTDFAKAQVEMAKEVGEHLMEESKSNLKVVGEVRDEYRDWYKQGLSEIAEGMRVPASA